jgi:LEA14-like dessication related protein
MVAVAWRPIAWVIVLGGCTPLGLWLYEDPVVTVSHVTLAFGQTGPSQPPVVVALAVKNRNDYPLTAEQVEVSLRLDGVPIGQLRRDRPVPVATDTVSTMALPLALERQATQARLRALGSGTHSFAVRGRATFRTPFGMTKVRFAQAGALIFGARSSGSPP